MSRSYKKHPIIKDGGRSSKKSKRLANKKVRRNVDKLPPKGKAYKKIYDSWDINDYVSYWTEKDAIECWYEEEILAKLWGAPVEEIGNHKLYGTLENYLNKDYKKYNIRK
jgi:hypothetical protein